MPLIMYSAERSNHMSQATNPVLRRIVRQSIEDPTDTQKVETAEELTEAIGHSQDVLCRARTVFPFTLFPDTVTLDRSRLSVTRRDMIKTGAVFSIRIEDMLSIVASVDMFFGSIKISTRFFDEAEPYTVRFLKRADALRIKRIVEAYLIARQRGIDTNGLETSELASVLDELGKVAPEEKV
jgi:hypothetical protein